MSWWIWLLIVLLVLMVICCLCVGDVDTSGGDAGNLGNLGNGVGLAEANVSLCGDVHATVSACVVLAKEKAVDAYAVVEDFMDNTKEKTAYAVEVTKAKTAETMAKTAEIASDKDVQAAAASAVGGAVVLGTGGAATGMVTGGAIGAAVGLVPAVFTLGMSIPICAAAGTAVGGAVGTAVGGTTGAAAGVGSYCAYTRREAIRSSIGAMADKVKSFQGRLASSGGEDDNKKKD